MSKLTVERALECEIDMMTEALCDGSLELNDEFIKRHATPKLAELLMKVDESEREYLMGWSVDDDASYVIATAWAGEDMEGVGYFNIPQGTIEVQLDGESPEDYLEEPDEWYVDGDRAYYSGLYGFAIAVDMIRLAEYIAGMND